MRTGAQARGVLMAAGVLVLFGAGALVYAPDNKTGIKVAILVAGAVLGLIGFVLSRSSRR